MSRIVYKVCVHHKNLVPEMHEKLRDFLLEYTKTVSEKVKDNSVTDSTVGLTLLERYAFYWNRYTISAKIIRKIFKYMTKTQITTQGQSKQYKVFPVIIFIF